MSKHHIKVLQVLLASITSMTLSCQTQAPPVQNPSLKDVPNLLRPSLSQELRNKIVAGKGNPEFVTLKTLAQMRQEGIPKANADEGFKQSPVLNKHFGVLQSLPVIDCETPGLSQCSFMQIGDFDEYNAAYRAAYYGAYPPDAFDTLCAYDEWRYCTEDTDNPGCFKRIHEIQFYGCTCPDFVDPNHPIPGCQAKDRIRVKYSDASSNDFLDLNQAIEMYESNSDQYLDRLLFNTFLQAEHTAHIKLLDASNQVVWSQDVTQTGDQIFEGKSNTDSVLPPGDYRLVIAIQGSEVSSTPLKISEAKFPLALQITHPNYAIPEGQTPVFFPPVEGQYLSLSVKSKYAWLMEIKDLGGSTVYYLRSSGDRSIVWEGSNRTGSLLPPGRYRVIVTTASESVTKEIEIRGFSNTSGLELYHSRDIRSLLDSVESRIGVMEIETEALLLEAQAAFPDAEPFQIQAMPDIAGFRVQQQQVDPPPVSYFEDPLEDDTPKAQLDAQNDRIVRDVEVMRQKINWVKQVTQSFQTQSDSESASDLTDRANKIQQKFYGVNTAEGCYSYYSYKPKWKKKYGPVDTDGDGQDDDGICIDAAPENKLDSAVMSDGKITLKGRILNKDQLCAGTSVDLSQLYSNFFGNIQGGTTQSNIQPDGSYTLTITQFTYSDSYMQNYVDLLSQSSTSGLEIPFQAPLIQTQTGALEDFSTQSTTSIPLSEVKNLMEVETTYECKPEECSGEAVFSTSQLGNPICRGLEQKIREIERDIQNEYKGMCTDIKDVKLKKQRGQYIKELIREPMGRVNKKLNDINSYRKLLENTLKDFNKFGCSLPANYCGCDLNEFNDQSPGKIFEREMRDLFEKLYNIKIPIGDKNIDVPRAGRPGENETEIDFIIQDLIVEVTRELKFNKGKDPEGQIKLLLKQAIDRHKNVKIVFREDVKNPEALKNIQQNFDKWIKNGSLTLTDWIDIVDQVYCN